MRSKQRSAPGVVTKCAPIKLWPRMQAQKPKLGAAGALVGLLPDTDRPPMARVNCAVAMAVQLSGPRCVLKPSAHRALSWLLVFPPILSAGRP